MTFLVVLQNQWVRDPDRVRRVLSKTPDLRQHFIRRFLFAGCKTGKILRECWGDWCDELVFEESSKDIGSEARSKFPPDIWHLRETCLERKPVVVIALGLVAVKGFAMLGKKWPLPFYLLEGPHPAVRHADPRPELRALKERAILLAQVPR